METNNKILVISTGGTFNKIYNPIEGKLLVDGESKALNEISKKWKYDFEILNIIGKDSLDINTSDRLELLDQIIKSNYKKILIIHGTDTLSLTAQYLADADLTKQIVLTGAMIPYSIDPVEATANFISAYTALKQTDNDGVYVALHGLYDSHEKIEKDRKVGKFINKI